MAEKLKNFPMFKRQPYQTREWVWPLTYTPGDGVYVTLEQRTPTGEWQVYASMKRREQRSIPLGVEGLIGGFDTVEEAAAYCLLNGLVTSDG